MSGDCGEESGKSGRLRQRRESVGGPTGASSRRVPRRVRAGEQAPARGPRCGAACCFACCVNDSLFWLRKKWLQHSRGKRTVKRVARGGPVASPLPLALGFRRQGRQFPARGGRPAPPGVAVMDAGSRGNDRRAEKELPSEPGPFATTFLFISHCPECSHMATSGHLGA